MTVLAHSLFMAQRHLRGLMRQPYWIAITLVQPVVWIVFYGQLFKRVVELPGFNATSYMSFVTPGIVIMTALFAGGWNGMGIIMEMERGIMDRFLVSPVSRVAIISGRLILLAATVGIQTAIIVLLGMALGARFSGGLPGILVLFASAILLAWPFGALSNALALAIRKQESVIGASNFIMLPLTFTSPVFMAKNLMPDWMRNVTRLNPVTWGVEAARAAMDAQPDWSVVATRVALLLVFAIFSAWLATRAFRAYQRSV